MPVILFHANLGCPGGFVGVDIFFVISGFLISSLILKEIKSDAFSLVKFWERRVRRILPALCVVVLTTLVAGWFLYLPEDFALLGKSSVAQSMLLSNVFFWRHSGYFAAGVDTMPLLHTWSLAVEEQFYVLFPVFLIFIAARKRFSIARSISYLAVGSFMLSVLGSYFDLSATFYLLPTRAWELMVGAFLAAIPRRSEPVQWLNETAGLCGLGLILYSAFCYTRETRFPGLAAVPPCLGAGLIIFSGTLKPTFISRILAWKPVVFVGLISYSLYLWHWPLLVFSKYVGVEAQSWELRLILLTISFLLAVASWKFVETPFRQRVYAHRRPQVFALAGFSMMTLMVLGGGVWFLHGMPSRLPAKVLNYYNWRNDYAFRNEITPQQAAAGQFAELGAQNTNQPVEILIWGDSHAMAIAPVLDELCHRFSMRGVEATHSATAPILGYFCIDRAHGLSEKSLAFSQSVYDFIAKKKVKAVILAALWSNYGPPDLVNDRLTTTVQFLMSTGAKVYVVKDVPIPGFDVPRRVARTVLHKGDLANLAGSQDQYAVANHDFDLIFNHLSQIGATILDAPRCLLNTNGLYDVIRDDKVLYIDSNHLTIEGSMLLSPMFEPLFRVK